MFWSGNYIGTKELKSLLKEENVKLTQILEADDILQECKSENKALIQYLTRPEVLVELVGYITEEPPQHVELTLQYRYASLACEVLTSQVSTLTDHLAMDTVLMNKLCDFINKDPPLNPLLASYYSKTIETLLEKSPSQDYCRYRIVCVQVLDRFRSRRDFLPNLLRHIATSAIADIFKYFIRLEDYFHNCVMQWFEEHKVLESLIQIICGNYVPIPFSPEPPLSDNEQSTDMTSDELRETDTDKTTSEETQSQKETEEVNHKEECPSDESSEEKKKALVQESCEPSARRARRARRAAAEAEGAAALLSDLLLNGCCYDNLACWTRPRLGSSLRAQTVSLAATLLGGVFTTVPAARLPALARGAALLRHMLPDRGCASSMSESDVTTNAGAGAGAGSSPGAGGGAGAGAGAGAGGAAEMEAGRDAAERAVAPHLPLLHQELLLKPEYYLQDEEVERGGGEAGGVTASGAVGAARLQVCALLAQLAASSVEEVVSTMLTLGTPGVVLELMLQYPSNNFLHAQFRALLENALDNTPYRTHFLIHFIKECNILTKLMDVYEENENKIGTGSVRAGYCGHVALCLRALAVALGGRGEGAGPGQGAGPGLGAGLVEELAGTAVARRWETFQEDVLQPLMHYYAKPLGGSYPTHNMYEAESITTNHEPSDAGVSDYYCDILDEDDALNHMDEFMSFGSQLFSSYDGEEEEAADVAAAAASAAAGGTPLSQDASPWESTNDESVPGEDWASFPDTFDTADKFDIHTFEDDDFGKFHHAPPPGPGPRPPPGKEGQSLECKDKCDNEPAWTVPATDGAGDANAADLERNLENLHIETVKSIEDSTAELTDNLLTAMSSMSAEDIAHIVNANSVNEAVNVNDNEVERSSATAAAADSQR